MRPVEDRLYAGGRVRAPMWACNCACGSEKIVAAAHLRSGTTRSCGCLSGKNRGLLASAFGKEQLAEKGRPPRVRKPRPRKPMPAIGYRGKDRTGERFGRLTVVSYAGPYRLRDGRVNGRKWHCRCDCGTTTTLAYASLASGNTRSCGCLQLDTWAEKSRAAREKKEKLAATSAERRAIAKSKATEALLAKYDISGQRYGLLTVLSRGEPRRADDGSVIYHRFNCICDCGNTKLIAARSLKAGLTKSCGCLARTGRGIPEGVPQAKPRKKPARAKPALTPERAAMLEAIVARLTST